MVNNIGELVIFKFSGGKSSVWLFSSRISLVSMPNYKSMLRHKQYDKSVNSSEMFSIGHLLYYNSRSMQVLELKQFSECSIKY